VLSTKPKAQRCPRCHRRCWRVHSRYVRTLASLPILDLRVRWIVRTRKFFCDRRRCRQKVFCERLTDLAPASARRTTSLRGRQEQRGLGLGANPSARGSKILGIPASASTFLRLVKALPFPEPGPGRVLGVDDWAKRKGHSYGTILCDLERGLVVDLLPDRSSETLAQWLREHPGIEIISRDRGGAYALGAREGAPNALQVADRFPLLQNLGEALQNDLQGPRGFLRSVAQALAESTPESLAADTQAGPAIEALKEPAPTPPPTEPPRRMSQAQTQKMQSRARRLARYEQVHQLRREGLAKTTIAAQVGLGRATVDLYLRCDRFPERAAAPTRLDPFKPYLLRRVQEGCLHGGRLFAEIVEQGYQGSRTSVYDYLAPLRQNTASAVCAARKELAQLSARSVRWLLMRQPKDLDEQETATLKELCERSTALCCAHDLCQRFAAMVRSRDKSLLPAWMQEARESSIPELARFADGLCEDLPAVEAGLSLSWSNGPVEGQVNRLKTIKRRMYGRAGFQLLRQCVVLPG